MGDALRALVALRGVLDDSVVKKLRALLGALDGPQPQAVDAYAAFAAALLAHTADLSEYLLSAALDDVNTYVLRRAQGLPVDDVLADSVKNDLAALQTVSRLDAARVKSCIGYAGYLPEWRTREIDFAAEYEARMSALPQRGYGMYAKHTMFRFSDGEIVPIARPDTVRLGDLIGYERQKRVLLRNTRALLSGRPAANALLFGDAGTGKSSTLKAIANEYASEGLRLVEVGKSQLHEIPAVMGALAEVPLKFIVFIDDLSFTGEGDDYYAVKAALEGSAAAKAPNVILCATSNRRHLIRERFSDREGDDVSRAETLQEQLSLSDRFGLTVGFFRPDKPQYLEIVSALAARQGVRMDEAALGEAAECFALGGGRSPRTAQQFIVHIAGREEQHD